MSAVGTLGQKRTNKLHFPSPEELARVFKRHKTEQKQPLVTDSSDPHPVAHHSSSLDPHLDAPVRHLVPRIFDPIVHHPYKPLDFFSDLPEEEDPKRAHQIASIAQNFPPPCPAPYKDESEYADSGILVPFIYPPIPVLRPDYYLLDPPSQHNNNLPKDTPEQLGLPHGPVYPLMYPLPFPPPNYMPYPLVAEKAPLTPEQVFSDWINALENLPRVDMVVASAAGSIFDLRSHAESCGLTVTQLDSWVKENRPESDPEADDVVSEDEISDLESGFKDYIAYANQIDKTSAYDKFATDPHNVVVVNSDTRDSYTAIAATRSSVKDISEHPRPVSSAEWSPEDIPLVHQISKPQVLFSSPAKDVTSASGSNKDKRREELLLVYGELESFACKSREDIYALRKLELLKRLRRLHESKIFFDDDKTETEDSELQEFILRRQAQRNEELVRLKQYHSYEKLKAALAFYQMSNRTYKGLNTLLTNKLEKLKHFFEYQQKMFDDALQPGYHGDLMNVRSKDSSKLYEGFVDHDFSNDIKQVFRIATANNEAGFDPAHNIDFDAKGFSKIFPSREHSANVHDMMPLITEAEFRMITGNAPTKTSQKDTLTKNKSVARHQIFLSTLYERGATSGSDTNASDSGSSTVKRRPGRRAAPKPALGEDPSRERGEAALVAKIMKQFVGPAAASANELTEDLQQMNLQTRWPVK